jgi:hypothetical protein
VARVRAIAQAAELSIGRPSLKLTMVETLVELQRLRLQLLSAVVKLTDEAERDPAGAVALSCWYLVNECQKLERLLGLFANEALKEHRPEGIA